MPGKNQGQTILQERRKTLDFRTIEYKGIQKTEEELIAETVADPSLALEIKQ